MRHLAFLVAFLAALPLAHADGPPGACECTAPPPAAPPPPPSISHVRVGVHVGSVGIEDASYGGGGLDLAYRFGPRWEIAASTEHATPKDDDTMAVDVMTLSARYHLRPWRAWDFFLIAGVGGVTERTNHDPTAQAGLFTAGAGVERRFHRFGVLAEVQAMAIGEPETPGAAALMSPSAAEPKGRGGGTFDLALAYHF